MSDEQIMALVGRNIRKAREAKGLSLRAFSASIGIDYKNLCNIENGKANPRISTILHIGETLGLTPVELFKE